MVQLTAAEEIAKFFDMCKHNLVTLRENLTLIGYQFSRPAGPFQYTDGKSQDAVIEIEGQFGRLPFLLRRWYETFRYVDFTQDTTQFQDPSSPVSGLGYNLTLIFGELESCIRLRKDMGESGIQVDRQSDQKHLLPLGAFASNCEPKGVWLPDESIDPVIYDDGEGPITFSQELCIAFRACGFPFWAKMFRNRRFTSPLGFSPKYMELHDAMCENLIEM